MSTSLNEEIKNNYFYFMIFFFFNFINTFATYFSNFIEILLSVLKILRFLKVHFFHTLLISARHVRKAHSISYVKIDPSFWLFSWMIWIHFSNVWKCVEFKQTVKKFLSICNNFLSDMSLSNSFYFFKWEENSSFGDEIQNLGNWSDVTFLK